MWSRWPSEVPPNLSYCVIMWINDFPGWAWPLPGRAGSQFLWLLQEVQIYTLLYTCWLLNSNRKKKPSACQTCHCLLLVRADLHLDLDENICFLVCVCVSLLKCLLFVTQTQTYIEIPLCFLAIICCKWEQTAISGLKIL